MDLTIVLDLRKYPAFMDLVRQYERHKKTITDSLTTFHDMLVKNVEKHIVRVQEKMNALSDS